MLHLKIVILLGLLLLCQAIQIKNRIFYDTEGRQIRFRGPNIVVKTPPYAPNLRDFNTLDSFCEMDMAMLKNWGFNGIRLGVMWAGVEPKKDWYNETYVQQMVDLVNTAGQKYGIYTLVEFHQDLIAEKFCGDGIPTWLIDEVDGYKTFPLPIRKKIPLNSSGLPDWDNCTKGRWALYYLSDDVGRTFNQLYSPTHKINRKFTDYWRKLASAFKGNKWLLGYEILNEPWVGDFIRNPLLIIPSVAERLKIGAFYDRITHAIREIDPITPICVQPITFDSNVPVGFSHAPGGKKYQNLSMLCYHYYSPPAAGPGTFDARMRDGKRLGIPSLLSEFQGAADLGWILDRMDLALQSWLWWDYKFFGKGWASKQTKYPHKVNKFGTIFTPDGTLKLDMVATMCRTYLPITAGQLLSQFFNETTKHFTASYYATVNGTSIIYLNRETNYIPGFTLDVSPRDEVQWKEGDMENYIELKYIGKVPGRLIKVTIDRV